MAPVDVEAALVAAAGRHHGVTHGEDRERAGVVGVRHRIGNAHRLRPVTAHDHVAARVDQDPADAAHVKRTFGGAIDDVAFRE